MEWRPGLRLLLAPTLIMALIASGFWLSLSRSSTDVAQELAVDSVRRHVRVAAELAEDRESVAGVGALDAIANRLGAASGFRVTFIADDGRVVGDSRLSRSEILRVDNHGLRPEVLAALKHGEGVSVRYSATLGAELLYVAIPYRHGEEEGVVRVARPMLDIERTLGHYRALLAVAALAMFSVASLLLYLVTRGLLATIERERREVDVLVAQRTAQLGSLQEMGSVLAACETLEEAAGIISSTAQALIPGSAGALSLFKPSHDQLQQLLEWGEGWQGEARYPPLACWALRRGMEHYTTAKSAATRCTHVGEVADAIVLCLPLQAQGETQGVLQIQSADKAPLTGEFLPLLKTLSEHAAIALGSIQLKMILREQAVRDSLTGLFNRRYLSEVLDREIARAKRHAQPLAVMMIDVDHFKAFNDRFGHEAGDLVLGAVGGLISDSTRGEDVACRYGGEEFVLLLAESNIERAREVGQRLCHSVRNLPLSYRGRTLSSVSVSIGIAMLDAEHGSSNALLRTADAMLYRAKQAGRDRVMVAGLDNGDSVGAGTGV